VVIISLFIYFRFPPSDLGDLSRFLGPWVLLILKCFDYLVFHSFDFDRTWWGLFQKHVMHTKVLVMDQLSAKWTTRDHTGIFYGLHLFIFLGVPVCGQTDVNKHRRFCIYEIIPLHIVIFSLYFFRTWFWFLETFSLYSFYRKFSKWWVLTELI